MKHLRKFNEILNTDEVEQLKDFCETSLAYLLDDGYDISVTLRDKVKYPNKQHHLVTLGLRADEATTWTNPWKRYYWNDVKDYFIPFLQMLVRRYELLAYPVGYLAFNTERGIFYLPLEQVINDEGSQIFECGIWGINIQVLDIVI
jgi:hypothetical protein